MPVLFLHGNQALEREIRIMEKIKVGVLGFGQMHIKTMVDSFLAMPEKYTFMGFADTVLPDLKPFSTQRSTRIDNRKTIMEKCAPIPEFESVDALLDAKPDLVIVATETSSHCDVICNALNRGIHVIVEKPMAMSAEEARKMADAAKANNCVFMVNWPTAWRPAYRLMAKMAHEGVIGKVLRCFFTNGESLGPFSYGQNLSVEEKMQEWWYHGQYGGGAAMDYIGYGCNLSRYFIGERATDAFCMAVNLNTPYAQVDDHATVVLKFPSAQALVEGTWATYAGGKLADGPVLFGEKGTLAITPDMTGVELYDQRHQAEPPKVFTADPLPEDRKDLAHEFLYALANNGEVNPMLSPEINVEAMCAADAALRSMKSGKLEKVD